MNGSGGLRAAVVGAGYLGTFHAEKYAALEDCELVGVADIDLGRATALADRLGCRAVQDIGELIGEIDCASVVVPTTHHESIATRLLKAGVDCLVEKPLATNTEQAANLVALANALGRILQVGHLERFNPALTRLASEITAPRFLECHRLAPFTERGADVDVVRDLMIHDLDLVRLLVPHEITSLEAVGVPVVTNKPDIANVRLRFDGGGIANITASRVSLKRERKLRLFQTDTYLTIDLGERSVRIARRTPGTTGVAGVKWEQIDLAEADALDAEIRAFVASVRTRSRPAVTGEDGLAALELCERILAVMESE
ncbi:MAG: Gfo/Idh/MocA family oxidoreductase [Candidatus Binatia bacterium]|nr:Gfo/Idh/MocA family oxidoreductase [Candidatus Binatia bacterium]